MFRFRRSYPLNLQQFLRRFYIAEMNRPIRMAILIIPFTEIKTGYIIVIK